MRQGKVVFTTERRAQALFRREWGGNEVLYIRVMRQSVIHENRTRLIYKHLDRDDMAEAIFHEAVHAIEGGNSESKDEECDAHAAGVCAAAAIQGTPVRELLRVSGLPIGEHVKRHYADLPDDPTYQPVGVSREWLIERTGLGWVVYPFFRDPPGRREE
jgi:hypothetical protein